MIQESTLVTTQQEEPGCQHLYSSRNSGLSSHTLHIENPHYTEHELMSSEMSNPKKMREWQKVAFKKLKDATNCIIQAFCGSGKTLLHVWLGIYDVVSSGWGRKQLIVVPQNHIHKGFVSSGKDDYISVDIDGEQYEWVVSHNFCNTTCQNR